MANAFEKFKALDDDRMLKGLIEESCPHEYDIREQPDYCGVDEGEASCKECWTEELDEPTVKHFGKYDTIVCRECEWGRFVIEWNRERMYSINEAIDRKNWTIPFYCPVCDTVHRLQDLLKGRVK